MGSYRMQFRRWHRNITRGLRLHLATCPPQESMELIVLLGKRRPPMGIQNVAGRRAHAQRQFVDDLKPIAAYIHEHGGQVFRTSWTGRSIHCRLAAGDCKRLLGITGVSRITRAKPAIS
jgi:hypothetical protein